VFAQGLQRLWHRETAQADNRHQDEALAAPPSVKSHPTEPDATANEQDELAGVIYAQDRQVIRVNGNDGYQYIDMTCFDIKQASFQGNRIHVRNGVQEFEIEYENITHVLFANGQQVELASCDNDYF
jgi:hemolysin activation/secretion protein